MVGFRRQLGQFLGGRTAKDLDYDLTLASRAIIAPDVESVANRMRVNIQNTPIPGLAKEAYMAWVDDFVRKCNDAPKIQLDALPDVEEAVWGRGGAKKPAAKKPAAKKPAAKKPAAKKSSAKKPAAKKPAAKKSK